MRAMRPLLVAMLVVMLAILGGYTAYPYVTLYRLREAVRQGDAVTLGTLVHWPKVRDGIKEDICDFLFEPPVASANGPALASAALPAFGQSFVRGIASNVVDRRVTPEALTAALGPLVPRPVIAGSDVRLTWAFFDAPTAFSVGLRVPGHDDDVLVRLELRDMSWRVTRVWLPAALLRQANAGPEVEARQTVAPRDAVSVAYVGSRSVEPRGFSLGEARE